MSNAAVAMPAVGRREDARVRVRLVARLVAVTGTQTVRLNNLSQGGASVTADVPPRRGSDVLFQWRDIDVLAKVTWVEGARCGLMFENPLAEQAVLNARSLSDNHVSVVRAEHLAAARDFVSGRRRLGYDS